MPRGSNNSNTSNPGWMGGGRQSQSRYIPRGGNDYSSASQAMAVAPVAAAKAPASTNPTTRAPEAITNSGPVTGGIVDSENRAGGRKRRARDTSFASAELLG